VRRIQPSKDDRAQAPDVEEQIEGDDQDEAEVDERRDDPDRDVGGPLVDLPSCSVRSLRRSWMFRGTSYGPIVSVVLPFSASDSCVS